MEDDEQMLIKYLLNDGFIKPQLTVEQPLYRYRSNVKYILEEIEKEQIYLASEDQLNDPFDSSYALSLEEARHGVKNSIEYFSLESSFLREYVWYDNVIKQLEPYKNQEVTLEKFSELLLEKIKNAGGFYPAEAIIHNIYKKSTGISKRIGYGRVASFSEVWDSIPMWSYYADNHKGVCIKYDFNLLDLNDVTNKNILESLHKVWYSGNRPIDKDGKYSPFIKGLEWAHEQEWRLFREFGSEFISLPCISEIYLGIKFDLSQMDDIINAVKKLNKNIKLYILAPVQDKYELQKILLRIE